MSGYVYILSNESLPGLVKIGITNRDPFERAAELRTTGVPTPFVVVAVLLVTDPAGTEAHMHRELDAERVDQGREFFRTSLQTAVSLLLAQAEEVKPNMPGGPASSPLRHTDDIQRALACLEPGANFNLPLAEKLLTASAKRGSAIAHYHLGQMICDHLTLSKKPVLARAIKHFEKAAAEDVPDAFFGLAWLRKPEYVQGYLNREPDPVRAQTQAAKLFVRALWTEQRLPDVYRSQYFIDLIPQIYTTVLEDCSPAQRSRYIRFLIYATEAIDRGRTTFVLSDRQLNDLKNDRYEHHGWRVYLPAPEEVARNKSTAELLARIAADKIAKTEVESQ